MTDQKQRIVLVTGGSRGIGEGITKVLLRAGYQVAIGYQAGKVRAEALAQENPDALAVAIDIGNADSVRQAFQIIKSHWGSVDILVNNAAMGPEKPFLEITDEEWTELLSVNVLGAVRCVREAVPDMQAGGFGRIVSLSSIAGQWGGYYRVHYAASKAALINLSHSWAKLYSGQGITSNAIAPGLVATDLTAAELATDAGKEKMKGIPCGRLATAEEIGEAVKYLVSEEAGYITGHTLNINGGMYFG